MRVSAITLLLCGAALAASPRGEFQKSSDTPAEATAVEAPAEVAPPEIAAAGENDRDKRQWFSGGFNPNSNTGYYPRTWWGNNHANYGAFGGFGGRTGMSPIQMQQYMQQMNQFMNNPPSVINTGAQYTRGRTGVRPINNGLPDVIDTGARGGAPFVPMPMLQYMYSNGFAPPFKANQPAFFQRSWQQYFSQFTNRMPGNTFDFRPQREVNSKTANVMTPAENTRTGSDAFSASV